jgi:ribosomal protein S6--L-glutamate ligase
MILSFHPCFTADRQIILGDRDLSSNDIKIINNADVIILPQSCRPDIYNACRNSTAYLFPNYDARFAYPGKIGQSLLFAKRGFSHPKTFTWNSVEEFRIISEESCPHDMPFLLKADMGHEADGLYLIENSEALESALRCLHTNGKTQSSAFISQDLVPSDGNVLRAVIMGNNIISYWKRPAHPGQVITTVSKGATIDKKWRLDLQEKGRSQAQRLSTATGINLAAIDFLFPLHVSDQQPVFLEINYYFGRRGLGGSLNYYRLLFDTIKECLLNKGFDAASVKLI